MANEPKKFLTIRNWSKFQSTTDSHGRSLEGRRRTYILDFVDKESDSLYAALTIVQRYMIDACRRLRGRLGRNIKNDPTWISNQLEVSYRERAKAVKAIGRLIEVGFLIPTDEEQTPVDHPSANGQPTADHPLTTRQPTTQTREANGVNDITSPNNPISKSINTNTANPYAYGSSEQTNTGERTETEQPPRQTSGKPTGLRKPSDPFWGYLSDFELLVTTFQVAAGLDDSVRELNRTQLQSYKGDIPPARLALLMWWAFRVSDYWNVKAGHWKTLDLQNFLRASNRLDQQICTFHQHDKWVKDFPTVESVLYWLDAEAEHRSGPAENEDENGHVWTIENEVERCSRCGGERAHWEGYDCAPMPEQPNDEADDLSAVDRAFGTDEEL